MRDVTDQAVFTGSMAAVNTVDVKARVTGYLIKLPFKEGGEVERDAVLAKIDPRPYQAQLDAAVAEVALNKAKLKLAETELARAEAVHKANPGAISEKALDQHRAEVAASLAAVNAAEAQKEVYKLNLAFTEVHSPIAGVASRFDTTYGNLVTENETLLTTVVS
ncbi:MAG: efflux RND transporter periplasmic adaptor subunit, partial [Pirellulales bacterium]|nr:efflux RND transporter periplasmic adaptor subunit [Pirellulales bacterium]